MKAALIYGPHDIRLETVETSTVQEDEILVKVKASGICGTDIHMYNTGRAKSGMPVIPGHEFSGEIVDIGRPIDGLNVGDRVIGTGVRFCGQCHWCLQGLSNRCISPSVPGEGLDGSFAEYVIVPNPAPGQMLFPIPEGLGWEEAATVEPLSVSCHAVRRARIRPGEAVVVLGAGMIGQCVAQVCKAEGASKVIVSEPSSPRLAMAGKLGADAVINPRERDTIEAVTETTSGEMADVVFECSGSPAAFCQAPKMVRAFGRIIQVGIFEDSIELTPDIISLAFTYKNLTLRGSAGQQWDRAIELIRAGHVLIKDLITHRFPLDSVKEAFDTQANFEGAVKVVVIP